MRILQKSVLFLLALAGWSQGQSAEQIMAEVRQVAGMQQHQDLDGIIKSRGKKRDFDMFLRGKEIHFRIDGGKDAFALRLGNNRQELFDTTSGSAKPFPNSKIAQPIAGTDVTYEDLAMKFLYWPNPEIAGEAKIKLQDCWRIHLQNPGNTGRYREVSVWVAKEQRALMRVIGYGPAPARAALKQFEVLDITRRNGVQTVGKLKIASFNQKGDQNGTTTIDFGRPKRLGRR